MSSCFDFGGKKTQIMLKSEIKTSLNFIKWKFISFIYCIVGNALKNYGKF